MQKGETNAWSDEDEGSTLSVTEVIRIFEETIQKSSQQTNSTGRGEKKVFLPRRQDVWLNIPEILQPGKFYNNNEMPDRPTQC